MHAKNTLIQLKEWIINGTIEGVPVLAQDVLYMVEKVLSLPADINEGEVHRAIKPHLTPAMQGKVMGALRLVLDMYQPHAHQHSVLHKTPAVHNAVIQLMQDEVDGAERATIGITLRTELWQEVIEAVKRDRESAAALRAVGLHMVHTAHGYAVKRVDRVTTHAVAA